MMKKNGFTLAEVLITLGVIGVVAAIVMPSVMSNYTYKTVGVKLQKFLSTTEGTTRPYVVTNRQFNANGVNNISSYIADSFLITNPDNAETQEVDCRENTITDGDWSIPECNGATEGRVATTNGWVNLFTNFENLDTADKSIEEIPNRVELKDGTSFFAYPRTFANEDYDSIPELNRAQVGDVVFGMAFSPDVNGLPSVAQKSYPFVVTELGYVYPDKTDDCMEAIANADYAVTSALFADGGACTAEADQ